MWTWQEYLQILVSNCLTGLEQIIDVWTENLEKNICVVNWNYDFLIIVMVLLIRWIKFNLPTLPSPLPPPWNKPCYLNL